MTGDGGAGWWSQAPTRLADQPMDGACLGRGDHVRERLERQPETSTTRRRR
jgi:hypothetical protein